MDKKFIVLTGVTRGLGRALLEGFIEDGHTVAGCGRNAKSIEELRNIYPAPNHFTPLDVTNDVAVKAWAEIVLKSHGAPDLLINNAALINRTAPLWGISDDEISQSGDASLINAVELRNGRDTSELQSPYKLVCCLLLT